MAQLVKNPPAMQETQVQSLGGKDSLEKEMATHFILAWGIPWTEESGELWSVVCKESDMTERLSIINIYIYIYLYVCVCAHARAHVCCHFSRV